MKEDTKEELKATAIAFVKNDHLIGAIKFCQNYPTVFNLRECIKLEGRYNSLKRDFRSGSINDSEYRIELAKIRTAVVDVIEGEDNERPIPLVRKAYKQFFVIVGILLGATILGYGLYEFGFGRDDTEKENDTILTEKIDATQLKTPIYPRDSVEIAPTQEGIEDINNKQENELTVHGEDKLLVGKKEVVGGFIEFTGECLIKIQTGNSVDQKNQAAKVCARVIAKTEMQAYLEGSILESQVKLENGVVFEDRKTEIVKGILRHVRCEDVEVNDSVAVVKCKMLERFMDE